MEQRRETLTSVDANMSLLKHANYCFTDHLLISSHSMYLGCSLRKLVDTAVNSRATSLDKDSVTHNVRDSHIVCVRELHVR